MKNSIIVSRYDEDICWLEEYQDFNIYIYNKGENIKTKLSEKVVNLPNVGRESHTWIYHIVKNYNNLDSVNIFLQGRVDDLGVMAFSNPKDYLLKTKHFGFNASRYGILGPIHWKKYVGIEKDKRYKVQWENGEISRSERGFRDFAKTLFPKIPIFVATSYGGCFAVTNQKIKQYDLNFYKNILSILDKHSNPIEGHFMERLWCYLFTENSLLRYAIFDVIKTKLEKFGLKIFKNN
tara:strand:+ start:2944 stop:3651 length:708 start_codon:yes stop_codon:yes gene_type:complete